MKTTTNRATATKSSSRASRGSLRFKRVLVPVDFSKCSREALEYAVKFATLHGSQLILLHVVVPVVYAVELGHPSLAALPPQSDTERAAGTGLAKLVRSIPPGVKVDTRVRVGQPYVEITKVAEELGADLMIISTHGYTGLKHVFLGSTAERVVQHATCPVLTLRAGK